MQMRRERLETPVVWSGTERGVKRCNRVDVLLGISAIATEPEERVEEIVFFCVRGSNNSFADLSVFRLRRRRDRVKSPARTEFVGAFHELLIFVGIDRGEF